MLRPRLRSLRLENLESRCLMAGNIQAAVVNGTLFITGDPSSNFVKVTATANPGEFVVTGNDPTPGSLLTSTVNFGILPITFSGVTADIAISMQSGDDTVIVGQTPHSVYIAGQLKISPGVGVDTVIVGDSLAQGKIVSMVKELIIDDPGADDAFITITGVVSASDILITGGLQEEELLVGNTIVGRHLSVGFGDGRSIGAIRDSQFGGSLLLSSGASDDQFFIDRITVFGDFSIVAGESDDAIFASIVMCYGSIYLDTGSGGDGMTLKYLTGLKQIVLSGGSGADQMLSTGLVTGGILSVQAGTGYDVVRIEQSSADLLFGLLGSGSDTLVVRYCTANTLGSFFGETGFDELAIGGNLFKQYYDDNFEAINTIT